MKEIFEVDLKGNVGYSIKEIVSIYKNIEPTPQVGAMDYSDVYNYRIELVYHNGDREVLDITKEVGCFRSHTCLRTTESLLAEDYYKKLSERLIKENEILRGKE